MANILRKKTKDIRKAK